jgi:CcmD family protein
MKKYILYTLFLLLSLPQALFAQDEVAMADKLREDGKIWVVVAIIVTIFIGILLYLISLDRKISRLEKEIK